eukprot:m.254132 g.254132  ORF g.254132 m.254132 type:complete len:315 (-) comp22680_c4_seq8:424-1368(-)
MHIHRLAPTCANTLTRRKKKGKKTTEKKGRKSNGRLSCHRKKKKEKKKEKATKSRTRQAKGQRSLPLPALMVNAVQPLSLRQHAYILLDLLHHFLPLRSAAVSLFHKSSLEMGDWKGSFSAIVQLFPHLVGNGLHFFRLSLVCLVSFQQRQDTQREERKPDEHRQQTRGAKAPKGQTRLLRLQQKGLILENGNAESVALGTVSSQTLLNVGFTGLVRMVRNCVSQRNSRGICSPALHVPPLALQLRPHVLQNVFLIPEAVSRGEEVEEQACCNNTGKDQPHPERKEMIPRCAFGLLDFLVRKHIACWLLSRHRL